jgi:hypothetical protein
MKTYSLSLKKTTPFILFGLVSLLFISCGTHRQGQYAEQNVDLSSEKISSIDDDNSDENKSSYYKQYFNSKESIYKDALEADDERGAIFTDIEAYYTSESVDEEGNIVYEDKSSEEGEYEDWGENSSENISISIYGGGYGYGYGYRPYWWYGSAWGYSHYYYPYWGIGYGYGHYGYPFYGGY